MTAAFRDDRPILWSEVERAVGPRIIWTEFRHSTLCSSNASGHRGCTCDPVWVPHVQRRDRIIGHKGRQLGQP